MDITQKSIADDIIMLLTKSDQTDESRLDEDYLYAKINQVRSQLIIQKYGVTEVMERGWMQDLGMVPFHKVNFADDVTISSCECSISKAFIPQIIPLEKGDGNQDVGLNIVSACGKTKYFPYSMDIWKDIPPEHERSLFPYFDRLNNALYVNKVVDQLRIYGVLQNPEDAVIVSSEPVASGSIANGTVYRVKYGQIIYDGTAYPANSTFTGTAVTTFTGSGKVYLNSQITDFRNTSKYPVSGDMARAIVIELLTKEYNIEMKVTPDVRNDSKDDAQKV